MSYLRYLCLFAYSVVIFCFVCLRPVSCIPNVASFYGLSIFFIASSLFSNVYLFVF